MLTTFSTTTFGPAFSDNSAWSWSGATPRSILRLATRFPFTYNSNPSSLPIETGNFRSVGAMTSRYRNFRKALGKEAPTANGASAIQVFAIPTP